MKKYLIALAVIVLVIVAGVTYWKLNKSGMINLDGVQPTSIACTQEAKICPDGSSVGRQGSNCEFAKCPNQELIVAKKENLSNFEKLIDLPGGQFDIKLDGKKIKVLVSESTWIYGDAGNSKTNFNFVQLSQIPLDPTFAPKLSIKGSWFDELTFKASEIYWPIQ